MDSPPPPEHVKVPPEGKKSTEFCLRAWTGRTGNGYASGGYHGGKGGASRIYDGNVASVATPEGAKSIRTETRSED